MNLRKHKQFFIIFVWQMKIYLIYLSVYRADLNHFIAIIIIIISKCQKKDKLHPNLPKHPNQLKRLASTQNHMLRAESQKSRLILPSKPLIFLIVIKEEVLILNVSFQLFRTKSRYDLIGFLIQKWNHFPNDF